MKLVVEDSWRGFVEQVVKDGRFGSADDVAAEGLRLVEESERKRHALREMLEASVARGGVVTDDELDEVIAARAAELRARGAAG